MESNASSPHSTVTAIYDPQGSESRQPDLASKEYITAKRYDRILASPLTPCSSPSIVADRLDPVALTKVTKLLQPPHISHDASVITTFPHPTLTAMAHASL